MERPPTRLRRHLPAVRLGVVTAALVVYSLVAQVRPSSIPDSAGAPAQRAAAAVKVLGESIERAAVDAPAAPASTVPVVAAPESPAVPTPTPTPSPPPPATPVPTTPVATVPAPPTDFELLRERILASISFPWAERLPGWRIEFHPPRDGFRGSTRPKEKLVTVYERRGSSFEDYRHVTLHELGHAVDVTLLDTGDRQRWSRTRGRDPRADWWVTSGADDFSSGAGDWAEAFAWWQGARDAFHSTVAAAPDQRQMDVMSDIVG